MSVFLSQSAEALEDEFDVTFNSNKPLGVQLSSRLRVMGFRRDDSNAKMAAERSGWIREGDELIAVNERSVVGKSLNAVVRMIASADLPKILRFRALKHATSAEGQPLTRQEEMAAKMRRPGGLEGITGTIELLRDGVPAGSIPFVKGELGGPTFCTQAPVAWAKPAHGCGALQNPEEVFDAFVLVQRGICPFSSKALIAQDHAARGVIVVNDDDDAIVMPRDDSLRDSIDLPAVMVASTHRVLLDQLVAGSPPLSKSASTGREESDAAAVWAAERGLSAAKDGRMERITARITVDGQYCGPLLEGPGTTDEGDARLLDQLQGEGERTPRARSPAGVLRIRVATSDTSNDTAWDVDGTGVAASSDNTTTSATAPAGNASIAGATPHVRLEFVRASFGDALPQDPLPVVFADPILGCEEPWNAVDVRGHWTVVQRGECSFATKFATMQRAGAAGMIVVNNDPGLFAMGMTPQERADWEVDRLEEDDKAPNATTLGPTSVMVTASGGRRLKKFVQSHEPGTWFEAIVEPSDELAVLWEELQAMLEHTVRCCGYFLCVVETRLIRIVCRLFCLTCAGMAAVCKGEAKTLFPAVSNAPPGQTDWQ